LVIITQTIELWKQSTSFKKHKIHFIKPAGIGKLEVIADGAKLQQVFLNLLENAAQHSSEDNEIQLVILEPEGKTLGVCVVDCGSGIPPENLPRIFEPFFSTRRKGTGLGLSIVKNIVETHGGEITVRNNDGSPGCTVEVSLPIAEDLES
ncbi:ATP-binding protein, partial [candidate division WOR-3 bacterium]|nr:ATP-binding protein [candidate division WOR-3 bacterium]